MARDFGRGARGDGRRKESTRRARGKARARSLYGNGRGSTSGVGAQAPAVVAPGRWRGEGGRGEYDKGYLHYSHSSKKYHMSTRTSLNEHKN